MKPYRSLVAIDPSLTSSGWVQFAIADSSPLRGGTIQPPPCSVPLPRRFDALQSLIGALFAELSLGESDLLICEGPAPLVLNPESALKLERVRSLFEAVARTRGMLVLGRVNPRTVQTELLGMFGKQLERKQVKAAARDVANKLYGTKLAALCASSRHAPQDVIDAALIGTLALSRLQFCFQSGLDPQDIFAPGARRSSRRNSSWTEADLKRHARRG